MSNRCLLGFIFITCLSLFACQLSQPETTSDLSISTAQNTQISPPETTATIEDPIPAISPISPEITVPPANLIPPTAGFSSSLTFEIRQWHNLQIPRTRHTATLLSNGNILLVGGSLEPDDFVADEELFNPVTGLSSWAVPLHTLRHGHTATLLPDGRVLVIGGYSLPQQWLSDAEIYVPMSDTWIIAPPLYSHGTNHTATVMKDGRVIVVGGCTGGGVCSELVEIFNPTTDTWVEVAPLESARHGHTVEILRDGRVLVIGGSQANGEAPIGGDSTLYDPQTNTWTATDPMNSPRHSAKSTLLPNGQVLVAGGILLEDLSNQTLTTSAEIFDPTSNTWKPVANLAEKRYAFVLLSVPNGLVLAIGGARDWECCWNENSFVRQIEAYDSTTDQWKIIGELSQPSAYATGILLPNGRVWIAGGQYGQSGATFPPETWLVIP